MKRAFDLVMSLAGIVLLLPLLLAVALWVKLDSRGPVLFRQERVGRGGRRFRILKFRTMAATQEPRGPAITVGADPRITRAGHVLRRLKLDELPQLGNVLWGDMSFVGPRPEVPRYVAMYTDEQRQVLRVRPGITDPASLTYRRESDMLAGVADPETYYVREIMPAKLRMNLEYLQRQSFCRDLAIIVKTVWMSLRR